MMKTRSIALISLLFCGVLHANEGLVWDSGNWDSDAWQGENAVLGDADGDGLPDQWEREYGTDPFSATDAEADNDNDGLTNFEEYLLGTNPLVDDSDNDGVLDGDEALFGTDPLDSTSFPPQDLLSSARFLELDDINGDGTADYGVFGFVGIDRQPTLFRYSGLDNGLLIDTLIWPRIFDKATVMLVTDTTGDGIREVALFGLRNDGMHKGKWQASLRNGASGSSLASYNWVANWVDAELIELSDLNYDGAKELALSGNFASAKRRQLFVRDRLTASSKIAIFSFPDLWSQAQYIQLSDHNKDGVDDLGFFGVLKSKGKAQIRIKSGTNEKQNIPAYNFPAKWQQMSLQLLGDKNGDGVRDLGLFGKAKSDGRWQLFVKKGGTNKGGLGVFSWPADIEQTQFTEVPDMDDDGVTEFAVFGQRGNKYQLRVKSGNDRAITHGVYNFYVKMDSAKLVVLPDVNNDGISEFGAWGINRLSGEHELVVVSGGDNLSTVLKTYKFGNSWLTPEIKVVDDLDNDGVEDIAFFATNETTQKVHIQFYSSISGQQVFSLTK